MQAQAQQHAGPQGPDPKVMQLQMLVSSLQQQLRDKQGDQQIDMARLGVEQHEAQTDRLEASAKMLKAVADASQPRPFPQLSGPGL
jgi:hypothetical protein